jgi:ABC-2 type transport system permease protein
MNLERIFAVVLRHTRLAFRDISRMSWMFYWPFFDVITWGFTGIYLQQSQPGTPVAQALLTCMVMWQMVGRAGFEISLSMLDELWSLNMLNMFASPLTLGEWISATFILGILSNIILISYCALLIWLFYSINIFALGLSLVPFIIPLFIAGLWTGFMAASMIVHFGARAQSLVFIMSWFIAPFCGVFYPIEIMPFWAQKLAACIPMTYLFTALRTLIISNQWRYDLLAIGTIMSIVYACIGMGFFYYMFQRSKQKGLARLTAE